MPAPNLFDAWLQTATDMLKIPASIRFPGGGDIGGFVYQPHTVWEAPTLYRGNAAVEQTIYSTVASPGKQLGKLTDLVLQMASLMESQLDDKCAFEDMKAIAEDIRKIKEPIAEAATNAARDELEKLRRSNESLLRALIDEYQATLQPSPSSEK